MNNIRKGGMYRISSIALGFIQGWNPPLIRGTGSIRTLNKHRDIYNWPFLYQKSLKPQETQEVAVELAGVCLHGSGVSRKGCGDRQKCYTQAKGRVTRANWVYNPNLVIENWPPMQRHGKVSCCSMTDLLWLVIPGIPGWAPSCHRNLHPNIPKQQSPDHPIDHFKNQS